MSALTASVSQPALQAKNTGGGPAGNFSVNAGVAPFTVNSQTKVTNLNADRLDGVQASQLSRLAQTQFDFPGFSHPIGGTVIASAQITTTLPEEYVHVSFDTWLAFGHGSGAYPCRFDLQDRIDGGSLSFHGMSVAQADVDPAISSWDMVPISDTWLVTPGMHTVDVVPSEVAGSCDDGSVNVGRGTLTLTTAPFNGGGGTPDLARASRPADKSGDTPSG